MKLLDHKKIVQKAKRLAIEILEHNYKEQEIILAGINSNGLFFAEMILDYLIEMTDIQITITRLHLNPADPLGSGTHLEMPSEYLNNKTIVIIDDVASTGRTLFYAYKPIMEVLPKKVEIAVLVNRQHKLFPVRVDYIGLSLATTFQENILCDFSNEDNCIAYLN